MITTVIINYIIFFQNGAQDNYKIFFHFEYTALRQVHLVYLIARVAIKVNSLMNERKV